jgi:hypothetical protein
MEKDLAAKKKGEFSMRLRLFCVRGRESATDERRFSCVDSCIGERLREREYAYSTRRKE